MNVGVIVAGVVLQVIASMLAEAHIHITFIAKRQEQAHVLRLQHVTRAHIDGIKTIYQMASTNEIKTLF